MRSRRRHQSGFTLLELVVVMAILTLLAGAALPVASRAIDRAARRATRAELDLIGQATVEFVRDTLQAPETLADLVRPGTPSVQGWSGPYLSRGMADPRTGAPGWEVDGWSRPYVVEPFEHGVRFVSLGRNGVRDEGGIDDIELGVDLRPLLRAETLATVGIVNRALDAFHAQGPRASATLPGDVAGALGVLVAEGLLPDAERFRRDAWGHELVADPAGAAPIVRVRSTMIGHAQTGSAQEAESGSSGSRTKRSALPASEAWRRLEQRARRRP